MQKIILFYKFVPVQDTETAMHWQKALAGGQDLRGRIIISHHGINGTLGGEIRNLKNYINGMNAHSLFKGIQYKWGDGGADDFPKLSVKVRPEIVTFGVPDDLQVDEDGVVGGGVHLRPAEVHKLVEEKGDDVVFMDGRNAYEAAIGKFKNAVVPDTKTTKDFIKELDKPQMQQLKDKPIVSYCTGGIRCEILTSIMKKKGFKEVYQIEGGIAKYGQEIGDDGFWEGKMYVFDKRMNVAFSDKAKDIGECFRCGGKTSNYQNCSYDLCSRLTLVCQDCAGEVFACSDKCSTELRQATLKA
jgi:UPF0176 protein